MGNIVSSPGRKDAHPDDDDGAPPYKRRRISSTNSHDVDHLIASPTASDPRPSLRLEVLKISHKDSKKVKSFHTAVPPRDVLTTQANCRVTVSDLSSPQRRVVHCQTQKCDLITFKNPVGPHRVARINLPRPFFIPENDIRVYRVDDGDFDLSDSYELLIELEASNAVHWPPLDLADFSTPPSPPGATKHVVLSSRFDKIFGRLKNPLDASPGYPTPEASRQTDYVMDIDLRWSGGFKAWKRLESGSMPSIIAIDPDAEPIGEVYRGMSLHENANGINNGHIQDESTHEHEDELESDHTPSRSLRTRERNKVYNLKVLSDQAQGRERKRRGRGANATTSEGRVTYFLPSDQPVALDYYRCIGCGAYHESMLQLQVHLETFHSAYQYSLEMTAQGPQLRVSALYEPATSPSKTISLSRPLKPFNLDTFASGDYSWASSRVPPDGNDDFLKSPTPKAFRRLFSDSPGPKSPKPLTRRLGKTSRSNKILVPETRQPLFDPISKAQLKPGQEVPKPVPDDTWLIQKHRESIADFSDVTPAEKEFIWEWDEFILKQNITSGAYFPRAWLGFVQLKAAWLVAAEHRMLEFGKHVTVLLARDALDNGTIESAFNYIDKARAAAGRANDDVANPSPDASSKHSPRASQIRKSASGCAICELPVVGPRQLICSNKKCSKRVYHSDCIAQSAIKSVNKPKWLCNTCCQST